MIRKATAQKIASSWHGGQNSALYQYASSGIYTQKNHLWYLWELLQDIQREYFYTNQQPLPQKDRLKLLTLLAFFNNEGKKAGIETTLEKHNVYGHQFPTLTKKPEAVEIEAIKVPN